jgi:hypothetical protein
MPAWRHERLHGGLPDSRLLARDLARLPGGVWV